MDGRDTERRSNSTLIAGLVIGICIAIGVVVWAGGWGFSNDQVPSPNPAQHAGNTSPTVQAPMHNTSGSR